MKRILVIDDDPALLDNVLDLLVAEGFDVVGASSAKVGLSAALSRQPDLIVCDVGMPVMDGYQVLEAIRDYPETSAVPFIFLTARAQREDMRRGMDLGADDYLTKPFTRQELLKSIRSRLERHSAILEPRTAATDGSAQGPVIASEALARVYEEAMMVARSDLPVLILGETGVGKDLLAHAIHKASPRAGKPYIPLNCAALTDSLLESELFGYEKGAFTGADRQRVGLLEAAQGGTVFLDEIGDITVATQAKLLRVLQDHRVMRVGGRSYHEVDLRFISATNRDMDAEVASGSFRRDLYYRIGVVVLTVPPLRERRAAIAPLAARFAQEMSLRLGRRSPPEIRPEVVAALERWRWPGNVRELRNVVERAVALSAGGEVRVDSLPPELRGVEADGDALPDIVRGKQRELERQRIIEALELAGGNQTKAARELGVSRRTLINRLDEFGLPRPRKGED